MSSSQPIGEEYLGRFKLILLVAIFLLLVYLVARTEGVKISLSKDGMIGNNNQGIRFLTEDDGANRKAASPVQRGHQRAGFSNGSMELPAFHNAAYDVALLDQPAELASEPDSSDEGAKAAKEGMRRGYSEASTHSESMDNSLLVAMAGGNRQLQ